MISDEEKETAQVLLPAGFSEYEMSDEEKEWRAFVDEMAGAIEYAKMNIYRIPTNRDGKPAGRQMAFLFECMLNDYSFSQLCSYIRDEYGSGVYKIQIRNEKGQLIKNKQISVESSKSSHATAQAVGSGPAEVIDRMSRAMSDQADRFEALLRERANPIGGNPIDQFTQMMGAMAGMMKMLGMGPESRQPQKTLIETLTEFRVMKELLGDLSDNDSSRVDNFWGAIAEAAKSFGGPLMQAIAMAQRSGQLDANGLVPERRALNAPPVQPTSKETDEMRQKLTFLLNQAKARKNPQDVADFIIEAVPDDAAFDALETFLKDESCIEQCVVVLPEIAQYAAWFTEWRRIMLAELAAMLEDDTSVNLTTDNEVSDTHVSGAGDGTHANDTSVDSAENVNHAAQASAEHSSNADDDTRRGGGDQSNA